MQPASRTHRVYATVFASLLPGEIRIVLLPGSGLADGGAHRDVPTESVPIGCRLPNTPLWVTYREGGTILRIEPRADDDPTPMY